MYSTEGGPGTLRTESISLRIESLSRTSIPSRLPNKADSSGDLDSSVGEEENEQARHEI